MTIAPLLGTILVLAMAVPMLFIAGARYMIVHRAGPATAVSRAGDEPFVIPVPDLASLWSTARPILFVLLLGTGSGVILLRFVFGIGAVTNLSDRFPWGLWIGFDVMSGVALAAGAFVIAATAHILAVKRFEPLVRPAILTGLLGYLLVVAALVVDLGRPYNVWRPLVHWQHHSALWEVGCCVATYTAVLVIEFLPSVLERFRRLEFLSVRLSTAPLYRLLRKVSLVFVVLGVVLSTLHQSSLGSLWVLVPEKLSPLWYSIYLPVFFWISAVAVGLAMTIVESTLSARAFKRGLEIDLIADLARAAAVVLTVYLTAKAADLAARGAWPLLFQPTVQAAAFWAEMGLGVVAPAILFAVAPLRHRPAVLFSGALMVVFFGVVLNRLNVGVVGLLSYTGYIYLPSWMEVLVTVTLVGFGVMAFGWAARHLPIFPEQK